MRAMVLSEIMQVHEDSQPLALTEWPDPVPGPGEVLLAVTACGVCHTELDEIEGRVTPAFFPIILGHQVVGRVIAIGPNVERFSIGDRVGVAWIFSACGQCAQCASGKENLCSEFRGTGRDAHGGYAEKIIVRADYAYHLPESLSDREVAPLLCAGSIGYRAFRLTELKETGRLGLMGFGASGHLVLKMVRAHWPKMDVYVFSRNPAERALAHELGAVWTGDIAERPPELLDAIIDTTPVWRPVVESLASLRPGGRLVINAIRKEEVDKDALLRLSYSEHLWMEKEIKTVANVTRRDVIDFLKLAEVAEIRPVVREYKLEDANRALQDLKFGRTPGAKVLCMG
ncbi:zinc-dependent alcohol dehydrogenase family protein [Thermogutta sp.]|uniref:zinc-dependent alcohol dehydrogenase family protein n=1 Tax=Thermogutta sp. TaxID=1962930 RepID=UPI00321F6EE7